MTTISCLWIQQELDDISIRCIKSWIALGYHVDLYTYSREFMNNISIEKLHIKNANNILELDDKNYRKEFIADLFRFSLFNKNKEETKERIIWMDTDVLLLKKIPDDFNYVSSQYTQQTGAFKCKNKIVANIGVMCFDGLEDIDWAAIINCKGKNKAYQSKYIKAYEKVLKSKPDLMLEPNAFCPVNWAWTTALFTERYFKTQCKYGIVQSQLEDILGDDLVYGVHLWRQIYKKKNLVIKSDSVYSQILNHLET